MRTVEMFARSQETHELIGIRSEDTAHAVVLFERFPPKYLDLISPDFGEKTSEQIWEELSMSGQIVAQVLTMSPSSMRKETIEYFLAPEREKDPKRDIDVHTGLDELRQAGVLKEKTLLDHWDTVIGTYMHHDEVGTPAQLEKKFAIYRSAVYHLARYTDNPGAYPELQEPEYTLTSDFTDFLHPPSAR